ncbi:MFS transporter [Arthrobacter sp. B2a2-09]|uniref:MFS transporter n=1 Tax=Arthrobacter sp. B2a2-09 TaxID=2952822 RepID=UPI0022CDBA1C|nr:MFS transporter [Arthrobacter sp. B2a2-09]MCZ9880593.1 MFS transporter [Arthrobacter sp. B2a2-09]
MQDKMTLRPGNDDSGVGLKMQPVTAGTAAGPEDEAMPVGHPQLMPLSWRHILFIVLANFGVSMAYIVPLTYSLALRIDQLAPGHEEVLGYATGIASGIIVLTAPLFGVWSDRTRSRLGRRRPFMIGGAIVGFAALLVIAVAPNVVVVCAAWVFANLGWGSAISAIQNVQADRLPDSQRGKVSGLVGLASQIAPVLGVSIAYAMGRNILLIFVVPGLIGIAFLLFFLISGGEKDSRHLETRTEPITGRMLFGKYFFNARAYPDFAWNLLGRFVFFLGLYANTTFSTFFYAQRLNLPVGEVAGTVAIVGILGIIAASLGAIGAGFFSDKLRRRKLFTMFGAVLFAVGAVVEAFAHSFPSLVAGALLMNLAIAVFNAVDQAIVLTVLPNRTETGRYMAIVTFAQKIPSAIAPLVATLIITIGSVGGEKNYTILYLMGGVLALIGGLIVLTKVKSVR